LVSTRTDPDLRISRSPLAYIYGQLKKIEHELIRKKRGRRNKLNDLGTTQVRDKARHGPWVQRWGPSFPSLMVRRPRRPDFATTACPRDASSVLELYPAVAMLSSLSSYLIPASSDQQRLDIVPPATCLRPEPAPRITDAEQMQSPPRLSRCNLHLGPPIST
jgi:hypothetical protein